MNDMIARSPTRTRKRPRPPGALTEAAFKAKCTRCLDCVAVCPVALIVPDEQGYPMLRDAKACGHCGLCAERCPTAAWDMQMFFYNTAKAAPILGEAT